MKFEQFSADYVLADGIEVVNWSGENAIIQDELYAYLMHKFSEPVVGRIGDTEYHFKPETAMPTEMVAAPGADPDDPVLFEKADAAKRNVR
jgi:hypothetical protein